MDKYHGSDTFLEVFNANRVEHVFFNPGIDNVPILEALSRYRASARKAPKGILCLDEFVAMTAAHGNYMASGRPQAVFVHSELGTQQVGGALHNAQWGRVPVVLCAEPLGTIRRVNWRKEPFDQGAMVRNCVKWDHELQEDEDMSQVLHEAFKIATSEPCGPVYLVLPRDTYGREVDDVGSTAAIERETIPPPIDEQDLEKAAEILIKAENPLIITGYSGRNLPTVSSLVELAETLSAPVLAADIRMNFPNSHPLSAYLDPNDVFKRPNPYLINSDVILAIDYDMHYAAPPTVPRADARIIHMDIDLKKRGEPLWGRRADLLMETDSREAIPLLNGIIQKKLDSKDRDRLRERSIRLESENRRLRGLWHDLAMSGAKQRPITVDWLCHCIDQVITEDTILVNQTITPSVSVAHQIHRTRPGTLLSCAGGSIGWALGAGLGVKLAEPERTVVSLMGDGAFIYGCPVATLWSASFYKVPFLSIIFNNQAYSAIKGLFRDTYDVDNMGADITSPPDYAMVAQACDCHGRAVEDPSDVLPALREAMEQVGKGRPSVVDVRLRQP